MPAFKDWTNQRFGLSVVIDLKERGGSGRPAKWNCLCNCGKPHVKNSQQIKAVVDKKPGHAGSCGARCPKMLAARDTTPKGGYKSRTQDLTGIEFGFSRVIDLNTPGASGRHALWNCVCTCGEPHTKNSSYINKVLKGDPKHYGSCSPKCAQDLIKRAWIEDNIIDLEILAEELEEKWDIEIGIGTLRQAKENGWEHYLTGEECSNGHLDAKKTSRRQCLQCRANEAISEAAKERSSTYRSRNPGASRIYFEATNYYEKNADRIRERSRQWTKENPERVRDQQRERRSTPEGRLIHNLRNRVNKIMNRINVAKDSTTLRLLGCEVQTAKLHIEKQFTTGMSWGNYGDWDVDHVRPCASFDLTNSEEQRQAFHYQNLQPLWSTPEKALKHGVVVEYKDTNISKGSLHEGKRHRHKRD